MIILQIITLLMAITAQRFTALDVFRGMTICFHDHCKYTG